MLVTIVIVLFVLSTVANAEQQDGDNGGNGEYPSCIGLDLATNFWFSGDVTSQESCQEACETLFPDSTGIVYDDTSITNTLANGTVTTLATCDCGSSGVLCQDVLLSDDSDNNDESTTSSEVSSCLDEGVISIDTCAQACIDEGFGGSVDWSSTNNNGKLSYSCTCPDGGGLYCQDDNVDPTTPSPEPTASPPPATTSGAAPCATGMMRLLAAAGTTTMIMIPVVGL